MQQKTSNKENSTLSLKMSFFAFFLIILSKASGLMDATWFQTFGIMAVALAFWLLGMYEVFLFIEDVQDENEKKYLEDEIDESQLQDHYRGKTNC